MSSRKVDRATYKTLGSIVKAYKGHEKIVALKLSGKASFEGMTCQQIREITQQTLHSGITWSSSAQKTFRNALSNEIVFREHAAHMFKSLTSVQRSKSVPTLDGHEYFIELLREIRVCFYERYPPKLVKLAAENVFGVLQTMATLADQATVEDELTKVLVLSTYVAPAHVKADTMVYDIDDLSVVIEFFSHLQADLTGLRARLTAAVMTDTNAVADLLKVFMSRYPNSLISRVR
jgi:hypothetical protein